MNEISALRNIPQELKFNGLWCGWKLTEKGKIPYNLSTDKLAKSNDPSTFVGYPQLLKSIHKYLSFDENGKQKGGIGLGIFRGYSAIDIDHCVNEDGSMTEMAADIIKHCSSYTELSPSGTGVRIILKTQSKIDKDVHYIQNHKCGLEIYISDNTNKFVTITGNRIGDASDINEVDLSYILDKYMRKDSFDIQKAIDKDEKLKELWNSKAPGSGSNESELDMALCCKLAYYLKCDREKMLSTFKKSPFYLSKDKLHKGKWETTDYINRTLNGAIKFTQESVALSAQKLERKTRYEFNDTGNAKLFVDTFGKDVRYNVDNCSWMLWNGCYWQYDVKDRIKEYVEILAEQMLMDSSSELDLQMRQKILKNIDYIYNTSGKNNLLKEAQHMGSIPVLNSEMDINPYLLCATDAVYDLHDGTQRGFLKEDNITQCTGCQADMSKDPERFLSFINDIFSGNKDLIHYVHKALGYSISNLTREQCMFILYGDGNNGKSLLLEVIREVLGSYGITSRPQLLTEQRNGNTNLEEIARLKGKRIIVVEEVKAGDKLDESLVKSLTSGIGNMIARFLYANSFEFAVKGKIWMATNYKPVIKGTDKGIWRRIRLIPLNVDFEGREDKDLKDKLLLEKDQILGWLIKGFLLYMKEGLGEVEDVKNSIKDYREEMDLVQQWIYECCETKPSYYETASDLFENFNAFCKRGKEWEMSQTLFGRNMAKKFTKKMYNKKTVYFGIRLRRDQEDLAKKVRYDNINVREDI